MKNHLTVTFGNEQHPSLFYWFDAFSFDSLKTCIEKRFKLPKDSLEIFYQNNVLDDKGFLNLYKKRLQNHVELKVKCTDDLIDPNMVNAQRSLALKEPGIRNIFVTDLSDTFSRSSFEFTFNNVNIDTTILDFKKCIHMEKSWLSVDKMFLLHHKAVLLDDDQLFVDLYMDGFQGFNLFHFDILLADISNEKYDEEFNRMEITIPGFEEETDDYPPVIDSDWTLNYPLLMIGSFDVKDIKLWIENQFQIPAHQQTILYENGSPISNDSIPLFWINLSSTLTPQQLKLFVFNTNDEELNAIYKRNGVRTMSPMKVTSFGNEEKVWLYHYNGVGGQTIIDFLSQTLKIPSNKFRLFLIGVWVPRNDLSPFRLNEIQFAVRADDSEVELLKILSEHGISRINTTIIQHPSKNNTICMLSLLLWGANPNSRRVCQMIGEKFDLDYFSTKYHWLQHGGEIFFRDVSVRGLKHTSGISENQVLSLYVKPNTNKDIQEICRKQVKINFLTGQFSIDLQGVPGFKVEDLKNAIYKVKGIAPHLQSLFDLKPGECELSDSMDLFLLNTWMLLESITLNLIIKPPKEVSVTLECVFHEGKMEFNMKESDTIADIKQNIETITNVPKSFVLIGRSQNHYHTPTIFYGNDDPIWSLMTKNNSVSFHVTKKVLISINGDPSTVDNAEISSHPIINYQEDTVQTIYGALQTEYKGYGLTLRFAKLPDISLKTKLKDIGERRIIFITKPPRNCIIT
uniref:Ubiquitin-like domain-containing protein n=1 Tax=Clytia hemisphaerica TaxID=252671 RepID=A0A7M5X333_9CNID